MTAIIRTYKIFIILITIAAIITMFWFYISQGTKKPPIRGVFVLHSVWDKEPVPVSHPTKT